MASKSGKNPRNQPCSCGSGKKQKHCCGRAGQGRGARSTSATVLDTARSLRKQGRSAEALAAIDRVAWRNDASGELALELARIHLDRGEIEPAIEAASLAAERQGETASVGLVLGSARFADGSFQEAERLFRRVVEQSPDSAVAHSNLANALGELKRFDEAAAMARTAVELNPDYAEGWSNLGVLLKEAKDPEGAEQALRKALALQPALEEAERNLVVILIDRKQYCAARDLALSLVERYPNSGAAFAAVGKANEELGYPAEATKAYRKAVELTPQRPDYHTAYLFALHYDPGMSAEAIFEQYREWDRQFTRELTEYAHSARTETAPDRRLRVGFLSPSFNSHPVGFFALAGIRHLDRARFESVALDLGSDPDHVTEQFRSAFEQWVDLSAHDDDAVAERIGREGIDILVDLAGLSRGNRVGAVARRPAPVIIKWVGGQLGSTGMSAFDGFITDWRETPAGSEPLYTERLYRLPDGYVCYTPPDYAPAVAPLPASETGHVTFGCFNKLAKINDELLASWARILGRVDGGRLLLKAAPLDDPAAREMVRARFQRAGGDPDALILRGWSKHGELLATYNEVDVALDSWPYSGGLTTCEALWMGVPVVSLPGTGFSGRHSATHLTVAGLADWVVDDMQAYEDRAVEAAGDLAGLARMRAGLRGRVADSPLCDAQRFGTNLGNALEQAWTNVCGNGLQRGEATMSEQDKAPGPAKPDASGAQADRATGEGHEGDLATVVARAEKLLAAGNLEEAGQICMAVSRLAPTSPDVLYLAGLINLASGRNREALDRLERALTAHPWDARFNRVTAHALEALGDTDRARGLGEVAERLDALRRGESGPVLQSAMAALETGQFQEALEHLSVVKEDEAAGSEALFLVHLMDSIPARQETPVETESGSRDSALYIDARPDGDSPADGGLPSEQVEVRVDAADGRRLSIQIPRNETFRLKNIFEKHEYSLPRGLPGAQVGTVVDVGANVGGFALYARGWNPEAQVLCFEPNPQVLDMLRSNVGSETGIRVFPSALSDHDGEITLYQHPRNTGETSVSGRISGARAVGVPVQRADTALKEAGVKQIDVLKIDTEGSEVSILEGLGDLLQRTAVAMLEYHSEADRRRIDELMTGFQLYEAQVMGVSGIGTVKYFNPSLISFSRR